MWQEDTRCLVFDTFLFYLDQSELKSFTLKAIGSVCIRHYELMLGPELKSLYHEILRDPDSPRDLKIQVSLQFQNLNTFCWTNVYKLKIDQKCMDTFVKQVPINFCFGSDPNINSFAKEKLLSFFKGNP